MADGPLGSVWMKGSFFQKKKIPPESQSQRDESWWCFSPFFPYCQGGVRINLHHAHFPNYTAIRSQQWGCGCVFWLVGNKHGEVECHKVMGFCFEIVFEKRKTTNCLANRWYFLSTKDDYWSKTCLLGSFQALAKWTSSWWNHFP